MAEIDDVPEPRMLGKKTLVEAILELKWELFGERTGPAWDPGFQLLLGRPSSALARPRRRGREITLREACAIAMRVLAESEQARERERREEAEESASIWDDPED